ncbi:hypothetical protein AVEN_263120-1 [Araneus ventricosus]|uniref:Uncharacterized protein n=1 Tax=Araneus ventricosus TaxID=182803 RepID=A0A4Y2TVS4_ARAVE|nr:hypothetical protein AVEN_263120-1 [Araneus ventricosus]
MELIGVCPLLQIYRPCSVTSMRNKAIYVSVAIGPLVFSNASNFPFHHVVLSRGGLRVAIASQVETCSIGLRSRNRHQSIGEYPQSLEIRRPERLSMWPRVIAH